MGASAETSQVPVRRFQIAAIAIDRINAKMLPFLAGLGDCTVFHPVSMGLIKLFLLTTV